MGELEEALAKQGGQYPDAIDGSPSTASTNENSLNSASLDRNDDVSDDQGLSRDFEGLKVENDGRVSFHGPTSLFQLPSGALNSAISNPHLAPQAGGRKERLVSNAWRERAMEQMATMAVRPHPGPNGCH